MAHYPRIVRTGVGCHRELGFSGFGNLKHRLDVVAGDNRGMVYWPLRVALSGKEKSPDPVQLVVVLGKNEVVKRVKKAIGKTEFNS